MSTDDEVYSVAQKRWVERQGYVTQPNDMVPFQSMQPILWEECPGEIQKLWHPFASWPRELAMNWSKELADTRLDEGPFALVYFEKAEESLLPARSTRDQPVYAWVFLAYQLAKIVIDQPTRHRRFEEFIDRFNNSRELVLATWAAGQCGCGRMALVLMVREHEPPDTSS